MFARIINTCRSCCASPSRQEDIVPDSTKRQSADRFGKVIDNTANMTGPTPGLADFITNCASRPANTEMLALDLGAGGGRDTRMLAGAGWKVIAVDTSPSTHRVLASLVGDRVKVHTGTLLDANVQTATVDIINAQRVLPFIHGQELVETLKKAVQVLLPGGHLCASFFGPAHSWNDKKHPAIRFHSLAEVRSLLRGAGLSVIRISGSSGPAKAANGEHVACWNEINVTAQKAPKRAGNGID